MVAGTVTSTAALRLTVIGWTVARAGRARWPFTRLSLALRSISRHIETFKTPTTAGPGSAAPCGKNPKTKPRSRARLSGRPRHGVCGMSRIRRRGSRERYVALRHWMLQSAAWRSLPATARAIYVEIAQRYNGNNNGRISYSVREGAEALHISKDTANRALKILEERGFTVCTKRGAFSHKASRDASEWRLTEHDADLPHPQHATKNFMRWQPPEPDTNGC
jgi:hypothetical protein